MKYLLGIDFGGGSSKATLIGTDGKIKAESTAEYPTLYSTAGACEQSPDDWLRALKQNVEEILKKSSANPADILCLAVDSATHTAVLCDKNFNPLRPAVHWTDSRSRRQAEYLNKNFGDEIFKTAFHFPDTIWTLPQLLWIKENEPDVFKNIRHIFFEKDFIRYKLTGVWCTDYIEAEGSMLFDCNKSEWSKALCSLAGIDISALPPVVYPSDIIGGVTVEAAEETGLAVGTPVACGTTDTCMEVFASGAVNRGDITVKLATAGRICVVTDRAYPNRHLVNYSHIEKGLWYPGTATKAAASSYRWYRDTFGGNYKELDASADNIPIGCDGLIFHPYINGELTPYADPALCGSFTGVRATHTRAHFTRAVLEGVCYSLLDSAITLDDIGIEHKKTASLIGGGAKGGIWRQMTADVLGLILKTTECSDSSFGSAMLAGIAAGVFPNVKQAVEVCVKPDSVTEPNTKNTEKYRKVFEEYKKIHDALAPIYSSR